MSDHTQIKHQFVRDPSYRIFVDGPLEERLSNSIRNRDFHFSPYLGVAYCEAMIDWVGQFPILITPNRRVLDSVLPVGAVPPKVDIRATGSLNQTLIPLQMSMTRKLLKTVNVLYKTEATPIIFGEEDETEVTSIGGDAVSWFAPW
jgi:CRISPR-associated protein Cas5h